MTDELRAMAASVGMEIPQAATLMMEAADTITELRGALQVASVDYRHLQDELWRVTELKVKADFENAKLREQAARAWRLFLKYGAVHPCDLPEVDAVRDEMRELGIEVE